MPAPKDETVDPHPVKATDSPVGAAWRERMGDDEAKAIYTGCDSRVRQCPEPEPGWRQFRVRSLAKVKRVALFFALAHKLMRMVE